MYSYMLCFCIPRNVTYTDAKRCEFPSIPTCSSSSYNLMHEIGCADDMMLLNNKNVLYFLLFFMYPHTYTYNIEIPLPSSPSKQITHVFPEPKESKYKIIYLKGYLPFAGTGQRLPIKILCIPKPKHFIYCQLSYIKYFPILLFFICSPSIHMFALNFLSNSGTAIDFVFSETKGNIHQKIRKKMFPIFFIDSILRNDSSNRAVQAEVVFPMRSENHGSQNGAPIERKGTVAIGQSIFYTDFPPKEYGHSGTFA